MKTNLTLFLSIILFCVLLSCNTQKNKEKSYKDFPMEVTNEYKKVKSWNRSDKPEFGPLYDYFLKKTKVIQGVPCKGRFTLDKDGKLYGFTLSEDHVVNGTMLPKGSRYEAHVGRNNMRNGYMIYLPENIEIQGYLVRHNGLFLEDYHVNFYNEGQLEGFKPVNDIEIDSIPCKGGKKDSWVVLYPDGRLKRCNLSKDIEINAKQYMKGTELNLDEKGNIR